MKLRRSEAVVSRKDRNTYDHNGDEIFKESIQARVQHLIAQQTSAILDAGDSKRELPGTGFIIGADEINSFKVNRN